MVARVFIGQLFELLVYRFADLKIRSGEKQVYSIFMVYRWRQLAALQIYNKLRTQDEIRYKPKKVENTKDKIFLLLQVCSFFFSAMRMLKVSLGSSWWNLTQFPRVQKW
jgi:hypothetical protein